MVGCNSGIIPGHGEGITRGKEGRKMGKRVNYLKIIAGDQSVAEWSSNQWQDGMINNAVRINLKRKKKIPDQPRYEEKIAEASVNVYKNFIDPNFVSRAGLKKKNIVVKHARKISAGYEKYNQNLDRKFETVDGIEAKRFKDDVLAGVERYARNARITAGLTGDKVRGYGAAALVPFWLVADARVIKFLQHAEKIDGPAVNVAQAGLAGSLKAGLEPLLVKTGVTIKRGDYIQDVIDEQNEIINKFLAGLQDAKYAPFQPGGASHCDWGMDQKSGAFYLEVQVSEA